MKQEDIDIRKANIISEIVALLGNISENVGERELTDFEKERIKLYISKYIKLASETPLRSHSMHLDFQNNFLSNYNTHDLREQLDKLIAMINQAETNNEMELAQLTDNIHGTIDKLPL